MHAHTTITTIIGVVMAAYIGHVVSCEFLCLEPHLGGLGCGEPGPLGDVMGYGNPLVCVRLSIKHNVQYSIAPFEEEKESEGA